MSFDSFPLQWDSSQFNFISVLSVGIDNDNSDTDENESSDVFNVTSHNLLEAFGCHYSSCSYHPNFKFKWMIPCFK